MSRRLPLQPLEWAAAGQASGRCEQGPSVADDAEARLTS